MAEARPIQLAFNGGRLDPRMYGRVDLARYKVGCRTIDNFIPTVQGPALKRSGTRFVKAVETQSKKSRLIPFEYSRDQAYVLEFFENGIRFMRDSGAVLESSVAISGNPTAANPCVITTGSAHGYSTGDQVYISGSSMGVINGQYFTVTVTGASTFSIPLNTTGEGTSGGPGTVARVYQIDDGVASNSIPWTEADLDAIQFAQDADVMYLVHPSYPPHKLARTSDTSWACSEVVFDVPPFRDENITDVTMYASAATGTSVTVTASAATFTSDMVGGYIKLAEVIEEHHVKWRANASLADSKASGSFPTGDRCYYEGRVYELDNKNGTASTGYEPPVHDEGNEDDRKFTWTYINNGYGYAKITGYTSTTVITVDVDTYGVEFPESCVTSSNVTKKWSISAFNEEHGYPAAVALYERRLWFGGTAEDPQTFWGSRTNRYEDFELFGVDADSGLLFTIASNRINPIQWMIGTDALIIGTLGGEFTAQSSSADQGITPDNITVKQQSAFGSAANVSPVFVDSSLIIAHRNGRRLHDLTYDFNTDRYQGIDVTAFAHDIALDGVKQIAYQASPFRQVWIRTTNGSLAGMTYVKEEDVSPWSDFPLGTASGAPTPAVESICVIPHPDGDQDQLWLVVKRVLGGSTYRWIEYLEKPFEDGDSIADACFVDASVAYSGSATTTLTGLLHLDGQIVQYILDDGTTGVGTVTALGRLSVASTTSAQVGFLYTAQIETMDLEVAKPPDYTSQGSRGRVVSAVIRVHNSGEGIQYGQRLSGTLDAWDPETSPLYTGDSPRFTLPGGFDRSRRIAIKQSDPVPLTLVALIGQMSVEGD